MPFNWFRKKKTSDGNAAAAGSAQAVEFQDLDEPSDVDTPAAVAAKGTPSKPKGAAKSTRAKSKGKPAAKKAPAKKSNQGKKAAGKKR